MCGIFQPVVLTSYLHFSVNELVATENGRGRVRVLFLCRVRLARLSHFFFTPNTHHVLHIGRRITSLNFLFWNEIHLYLFTILYVEMFAENTSYRVTDSSQTGAPKSVTLKYERERIVRLNASDF